MTPPITDLVPPVPREDIPVPDVSRLVTEDDTPVDNVFSEKQMRLLTEPLYSSWSGPGEGRPYLVAANVGVFPTADDPPMVPDVFLVVDTKVKGPLSEKRYRSYFLWDHGKPPDVVIEIVSNNEGEELSRRLRRYERMRVPYYVVFDPFQLLSDVVLRRFDLHGGAYVETNGDSFDSVGLGLRLWQGSFEDHEATWLRWYDTSGEVIATGCERASQSDQRAGTEAQRADTEAQRADRLAAKLRELGVDPDK